MADSDTIRPKSHRHPDDADFEGGIVRRLEKRRQYRVSGAPKRRGWNHNSTAGDRSGPVCVTSPFSHPFRRSSVLERLASLTENLFQAATSVHPCC